MDNELRERQRTEYRPRNTINVLFVGESPPSNGDFFYHSTSDLFTYTRRAFDKVFGEECMTADDFLKYFQEKGCYLEDFCREPIDDKDDATRRKVIKAYARDFSSRLVNLNPKVVVLIAPRITRDFINELWRNKIYIPFYPLPFPTVNNRVLYGQLLYGLLVKLRKQGIVT